MKITSIINIQNPVVLKNFRMMKLIIKTKIKIFLILNLIMKMITVIQKINIFAHLNAAQNHLQQRIN